MTTGRSRWPGLLCLVLGVVAIAAVAGAHRLVPGSAVLADRLRPPPVGSCLALGDSAARPVLVDCRGWHEAVVVSTGRAPLDTGACAAEADGDAFRVAVWPRRFVPLGVRQGATSLLGPAVGDRFVGDTPAEAAVLASQQALPPGLRPWGACARFAVVPELGMATEVRTGPDGALQARWCLDRDRQLVGCDRPHPAERLGVAGISAGDVAAAGDCGAFAAGVIGVGSSLDGTPLRARAVIVAVRDDGRTRSDEPSAVVACDVRAPSGRSLVGSVVGHGSAPIELR